jgi:hypothetical protein
MRPEKVFGWREQLPPPFDQLRPTITRRDSIARVQGTSDRWAECKVRRRRSESASGAVDQADRSVNWLKFFHASHAKTQQDKSDIAIEKLRRLALRLMPGRVRIRLLTIPQTSNLNGGPHSGFRQRQAQR